MNKIINFFLGLLSWIITPFGERRASNTAYTISTNRAGIFGLAAVFARDGATQVVNFTGGLTSASATATVTDTTGLAVGMVLSGTDVAMGATIVSIIVNTSILMSAPATGTASSSLTATGTVSKTFAPAAGSSAFLNLGQVTDGAVTGASDDVQLFGSVNGKYGRTGVLLGRQTLDAAVTFQEFNEMVIESGFMGAGPITLGTPFMPFGQTVPITGWLSLTYTDGQGVACVACLLRGSVKFPPGLIAREKDYAHPMTLMGYSNALNLISPDAWTAYSPG